MAARGSVRDRFANIAAIETIQSAANILTFSSLATNMGFLGQRDHALAMVIDEIQFAPATATINLMTAGDDEILMAICTSNQVTNLQDLTDNRIIDFSSLKVADVGTPTSRFFLETPFRKQFFPPLITAERTLYLGIDSTGLGGAGTVRARILYRVETLTGAELLELSEVFRLTG